MEMAFQGTKRALNGIYDVQDDAFKYGGIYELYIFRESKSKF
jgi:hypothetical protein